jgi:hypothetical protein
MSSESIDKILTELKRVENMLLKFQNSGKIPDIEREIVLSKLRNIYEFINIIQLPLVKAMEEPTIDKEPLTLAEAIEETAGEVPAEENQPELKDFTLIEIVDDIKTNTLDENQITENQITENQLPENQLPDNQVIQQVKIKPEQPAPILADKFHTNNNFLNEALANFQHLQNISKKYQTKPIKDISSAISLNDKFLYIKELFGNDGNLYKQTIEILNNSGDFNSAIKYLDNHFQWDFNDFQVQKIIELVHRRYMPSDE